MKHCLLVYVFDIWYNKKNYYCLLFEYLVNSVKSPLLDLNSMALPIKKSKSSDAPISFKIYSAIFRLGFESNIKMEKHAFHPSVGSSTPLLSNTTTQSKLLEDTALSQHESQESGHGAFERNNCFNFSESPAEHAISNESISYYALFVLMCVCTMLFSIVIFLWRCNELISGNASDCVKFLVSYKINKCGGGDGSPIMEEEITRVYICLILQESLSMKECIVEEHLQRAEKFAMIAYICLVGSVVVCGITLLRMSSKYYSTR